MSNEVRTLMTNSIFREKRLQDLIQSISRDPEYVKITEKARQSTSDLFLVEDDVIEFYGRDTKTSSGKPGMGKFLSNCYRVEGLKIGGKEYPSTECYYQMYKFRHGSRNTRAARKEKMKKMLTLTPVQCAMEGRKRDVPMREDWEQIKVMVMYRALLAKFNIEPFKSALLTTGSAVLIERAPRDDVWAINDKGEGTNFLGILLMIVREYYKT